MSLQEYELEKELKKYKALARKMARLLMELSEGHDVHDDANNLVEKHFPNIYEKYQ